MSICDKSLRFFGIADGVARLLARDYLRDVNTWKKFVDLYRSQPDGENFGWRGEYWGKMMRGAVLVYQYEKSEELYTAITASVCDMLTVIEEDGRVSSYSRETEFDGWDIWNRKYVILACEYYLEICKDEGLRAEIIDFISRAADYILENIGEEKKDITKASRCWFGLNSASILEPMVRLYRLTGEGRYLDFSSYIVKTGGTTKINVFELAYENTLYPYQYGVSKAYELISCFEGLLEYYEATGIEKYKTAAINFAKAVLDSEISIIGSCGTTHELFDHTLTRQTAKHEPDEVMQETCVTVTLMKFFARILEITEDSAYADAIERSFYNAYLGALNTERRESEYPYKARPDINIASTVLPFDSYSPLTPGKRGRVVGGFQVLPDRSYYGCCACIGAAGVGIFLKNALTVKDDTVTINFYETGEVNFICHDIPVSLKIDTGYPIDGKITVSVFANSPVEFKLKLRNPEWSGKKGYTVLNKVRKDDIVELNFDMSPIIHYPRTWDDDVVYTDMSELIDSYYTAAPITVRHNDSDDNYFAVTRGPLTLGADSRTGKALSSGFSISGEGEISDNVIEDDVPCLLKMKFTAEDGEEFYLVDYAHAGRDWKSEIAAWLPTDKKDS